MIFAVVGFSLLLVLLLAFHFKPHESRFEIERLAERQKSYRELSRFLDIYPGLTVITHSLALVDVIVIAILSAWTWGFFVGGAITFVVTALAVILGRALQPSSTEMIRKHLGFFTKYFSWAKWMARLNNLGDEPRINSEHELVHLIKKSDVIDEKTKNLLTGVLNFRDKTAADSMTPRDEVAFVQAKDPLTPGLLDELFNSGHKVFPVAEKNLDHTVGLLFLDDVLPIEQEEKVVTKSMRKLPPAVAASAPLESALRQMCEYNSSVLMVEKDDKTIGFLTLSDITRALLA
ncbi:CBS domain-containing protein [Candidatus Saccharibacteria bacterium]|nr:CBS domain-containing protein [Candidatus Saccharibacteria bacterium]